ncbi:hypothetical protein WDU94_003806 [Cyamophila willieti]
MKCRNQPTQQEAVEYQTNIAACNEESKVIMNSFGQKKSVVFECEPKKDNKDSNGYAGVEVREMGDDSPIKRISPIKRNCNIDDKLDRVVKTVHRNNSQETVDSGVGLEENVVNSVKANTSKLMNELGLRGNSVNSREMRNVVDGWKNAKTVVNRESYGSVKDTTKTGKHQDNTSDTSQKSTIVLGSNVSGNDCVNTNNRDKYSSPNDTSSSLTEDFDKVPDLFSVDIEDKLSLIPGKSNKQVVFLKRGVDRTKWKLERFETIHESNLRYKRTPFVTDVCNMKVKLENSTKCKPAKLKNAKGLKKEAHLNGNKRSKKGARVPKLTDKKKKLSDKLPVAMLNRKANLKKQLIESKDVSIHDANGDDPKQSIQNKGGMLHFALPRPTLKGQENGSKTPEDTINRKPVKNQVEFLQVQKQSMSKPPNRCQIHESNLRYKRTPFVTDVCTQSYIGQESQGWLLDETMLEHYVEGNKGVGKDSVSLENYETEVQTRTEFEINNEIAKREYGKVQKEHSNIENHGETNTDISKNQGKNSCLETNHNEAEMNENEMEVNSLDLNDLVEIMQPQETLDSVLKNNYKEFVVKRGVPKIRGATNLVTFKLKTYASKRYGPSVTVDTSQYPTGFDRKQYQVLKDMKVKLENSTKCKPAKLKNANGLKKEAHLNGNKRSKKGARVPKLTDKKKKLSDKLPVAMLNRKANLKKQLIESKDVSIHDANGDDPKQSIQNSGGMLHFALPRPTLKGQENGSKTPEDTINRKPVKNQVEFLQVQKQSMSKPPNRCQIHESNLRYKRTPFVTDVCTQSYIGQESQGWLLDETMLEHYVEGNKGVGKDSVSLENYETEVQTRTEFEINNEIAKREYGKVQKEHSNIENHGETNTDISKNQGKNSCLETNHNEAEMNENEMEVNSLDLNDLVEIMQPQETLDSVLKNNYKEFVVKRGVPKICGATNLVTFKLKTYASKSSCPSVTVDTSQYPTGFDRKQYQVLKDMKVKLENSTKCKPAKLKNANGLKKEAHLNGNKRSKKGARVPKLTDKKKKLSDKLPVAMLNRKAT